MTTKFQLAESGPNAHLEIATGLGGPPLRSQLPAEAAARVNLARPPLCVLNASKCPGVVCRSARTTPEMVGGCIAFRESQIEDFSGPPTSIAISGSRHMRRAFASTGQPSQAGTVKNQFGSELSMAVIEACRNSFGGESFLLRVHPGSNIIILSTPHEQVAGRLREINQLKIRGRIHPFNAYVADPEDVLRGIAHGLPPRTTQADLMANLRIPTQGGKIERARMLGSSKSAIITFTGDVLPRCVYFMGAEAICYPYKPTVQVCKICRSTGHRTDVCPTPNSDVCSKCGTCDPTQRIRSQDFKLDGCALAISGMTGSPSAVS
ncbi:hypothetical protein HPB51_008617 [Rhipicephalus microplus]|uniref:Uncharacterized protein n=1 Tax=Rhipicephalus microplus TaxID=6941 RepID=A0A9J6EN51_RHIMP|nr:hypothetical protein HPB51_008617 [Rhipicephalus microplus]